MRLGDWLIEQEVLSPDALQRVADQVMSSSAVDLATALVKEELISEYQSLQALAHEYYCDTCSALQAEMIDPELTQDLPLEYVRSRTMLPVRYKGGLAVLTNNPLQVLHNEHLGLILGEEAVPLLAEASVVNDAIEACYLQSRKSVDSVWDDVEPDAGAFMQGADLLQSSDQAPVAQFVNLLLLEALQSDASDIHVEPFQHEMAVRFRIDGRLQAHTAPPKHVQASLISRLKIMGDLDIAEKRLPQDGMTKVRVGEREVDVRISTVPVAEGERIVLRLLRHDAVQLTFSQLGMSDALLKVFRGLLREPHGVIWVTGPTGSGKTTTLYAALQEMDTAQRNVMTIEDPVEYQLPAIGQIEVKPKIGLTFSQGLRHILRQDPDVILVGETRDYETADIVVSASLTGHLVFSTLHTNDAASAVARLTDMGVESYLVAESTRGMLAQRLVRRLCPSCRQSDTFKADAQTPERLRVLDGQSVFVAQGCALCRDGYKGRNGLFELVVMQPDLQDAVRAGEALSRLRELAAVSPIPDIVEEGINKVLEGLTSVDELLEVLGQGAFSVARTKAS